MPLHRRLRDLRRPGAAGRAPRGRARTPEVRRARADRPHPPVPLRSSGPGLPGARAQADTRLPDRPPRARAVPGDALGPGHRPGAPPGVHAAPPRVRAARPPPAARGDRRAPPLGPGRALRVGPDGHRLRASRRRSTSRRGSWSTPATGWASRIRATAERHAPSPPSERGWSRCSVDDEGLVVDRRRLTGVRLVYTTPAHQYPLGVTMSVAAPAGAAPLGAGERGGALRGRLRRRVPVPGAAHPRAPGARAGRAGAPRRKLREGALSGAAGSATSCSRARSGGAGRGAALDDRAAPSGARAGGARRVHRRGAPRPSRPADARGLRRAPGRALRGGGARARRAC